MNNRLTFAEQQIKNKKDKIHGWINTVAALALGIPLFVMIMHDLAR